MSRQIPIFVNECESPEAISKKVCKNVKKIWNLP